LDEVTGQAAVRFDQRCHLRVDGVGQSLNIVYTNDVEVGPDVRPSTSAGYS